MRTHGCIESGAGLGADSHACWTFDSPQDFADASVEYLGDGLRHGQRLLYIGSEPVAEQRERLEALGDVGGMIDAGALLLLCLDDLIRGGGPIPVDTQLAVYAAATDAALADGYTGLRVAAQATDLVADPDRWEAHMRWESIADRFMSERPLSAMCGYSREAVPEPLMYELAAAHPVANGIPEQVPFHLFSDSGSLVLAGEIDFFSAGHLDRVLDVSCHGDGPVSLELGELDFIDHRGLEVLAAHIARFAADRGCAVHNRPPTVDRLCDLLELQL